MHALKHKMPGIIHTNTSLLSRAAPSQKYNTSCPLLVDQIDYFLREALPAFTSMTISLMCSHCQACVEHQDATICPWSEKTTFVSRLLKLRVVLLERFIDVDEGWWSRCWWADREAETVGLIVVVIWVLTEYHGLDCAEWCMS
jgi:hypothetical protein